MPVPVKIPLYVVFELFPKVKVAASMETVPAVPDKAPIVLLNPLRSSVAPVTNATFELGEKAFAAPACSVPAFSVVVPE